jgi:hypothetical protein
VKQSLGTILAHSWHKFGTKELPVLYITDYKNV